MSFHYIAIDGPTGVGKSAVIERMAERLEATVVSEDSGENPFLKPFYDGRAGTAFQTEVFFLLSRFRRQQELLQRPLFSSVTLCDYVFEKSRLYSYLNLEDAELVIFEKLYGMLVEGVPQPDLVVYLQASPERLAQRVRQRGRAEDHAISEEYLQEICRAYNHYFFHYSRTPLLVVNTTDLDLATRTDQVDDLIKQIEGMGRGTRYYVPLAESK